MSRILVIDNHDSFVYTIVGYLQQLGATTTVIQNDEVDPPALQNLLPQYDGILISPGPGNPETAGITLAAIAAAAAHKLPMLGVCLGHQALAAAYGATVAQAPELLHGQTSQVIHHGNGALFNAVPQQFTVTRYHSLAVLPTTVPECLIVTASTTDGVIMGLEHRDLPLYSVQYHPEAVLTEYGHQQLANWLAICRASHSS